MTGLPGLARRVGVALALPPRERLLVTLLMLAPLLPILSAAGPGAALVAAAGLAAHILCIHLAYGEGRLGDSFRRRAPRAGWLDAVIVPVGLAGLVLYAIGAVGAVAEVAG